MRKGKLSFDVVPFCEKTRLGEFLDGGFRLLGTGVATPGDAHL